jgi:NADH dehydrogenase
VSDGKGNIVILGAGYGGLTATLRLAGLLLKHPEYQVHLIDKNPYHTLKTQLHEAAVRKAEVSIPIDRIINKLNIIFYHKQVTRIDPVKRLVYMKNDSLSFEYLVIAMGSRANFYGIPGLREHSFSLQTLYDAQLIYNHIHKVCEQAAKEVKEERRKDMLRFMIGGGGLSGVELSAELADYIVTCIREYNLNPDEVEIILIEAAERIVPQMDKSFAEHIIKKYLEKGIKIITGTGIINLTHDSVTLSSGEILTTKTLIWTGGIRISDLVRESGMKIGQSGRIVVDEFLGAEGFPFIYAIGDNALAINPDTGKPVPASAQFALQQGRLVANNIYADISGGIRRRYRPRVMGEVVSLGRHLAVGWLALPFLKKFTFAGFLGSLIKSVIQEKHILLLKKERYNWVNY